MYQVSEERDPKSLEQSTLCGAQPAIRPPSLGFLQRMLVGSAVLATFAAVVAGSIWGWPAGIAVIGFVAGNYALAKALIDLHLQLNKTYPEALRLHVVGPRPSRREFAPLAVLALSAGLTMGVFGVPKLADWATGPSAKLDIPRFVSARQDARVMWWNIPDTEDVRVIVRRVGDYSNFVQECRGAGSRKGVINCAIEIGGRDDQSRRFDIRAIHLPRDASEKLSKEMEERGYVHYLPEGTQLLVSKEVVRNGFESVFTK